jgi:hypothetical protein
MDAAEARAILREELDELRRATYDDLVLRLLDKPQTHERTGRSGIVYQVELQAFWDDRPHESLRVLASIDDGGFSAFRPLSDDFIRAPDGSFVGE